MVKVRELVHGNLTLNLWWETSYSSGVCADPQTELRRGEARRARGQCGSCNPPYRKVVAYVCVRVVFVCIFLCPSLFDQSRFAHQISFNLLLFKSNLIYLRNSAQWLFVCVRFFPLACAEVREMSCSVCVWLTLRSPPLIAGSMGCRQMPIFIGS